MKYIAFFVLAFVFLSCKKGQADFVIAGNAYDHSFSTGLANAKVDVYKKTAGSEQDVHVTSVYTDSEGNFKVEVKRDQFLSLTFYLSKDGYYNEQKTVNFSDLTLKEENTLNLDGYGKSWVKIHLVHTQSATTKMDILKSKGKSACDACCPEGYQQFVGIMDSVFYCANNANSVYEITYFKQFSSFSGKKEVYTTHMDTVELLLSY
jgi:hypothetical protein